MRYKTKKSQSEYDCDSAVWRCLADSNRRRRFCRPLTKPLIQGTISLFAVAKLVKLSFPAKYFSLFFHNSYYFFSFLMSVSSQHFLSFSISQLLRRGHPSQPLSLFLRVLHTYFIAIIPAARRIIAVTTYCMS